MICKHYDKHGQLILCYKLKVRGYGNLYSFVTLCVYACVAGYAFHRIGGLKTSVLYLTCHNHNQSLAANCSQDLHAAKDARRTKDRASHELSAKSCMSS